MKRYPTREGIPISPEELGYYSEPEVYQENHHLCFTRREMGRFAVTQTLRDLDTMQFQLPKSQHTHLHRLYLPPEVDLERAYEYVREAYDHQEQLRYGSAKNFKHHDLTEELMAKIDQEFSSIRHLV